MPTRKATNNKLTNWLLRSLLVVGQRTSSTQAGFVLPTVVMVTLVVTLLTAALVVRSFDRSKNASNTRVNEVVLNAATPALDRAKAKIDALFDDPSLPRSTPADIALYNAVANNLDKYTFGDEKPIKVLYDINGDNTIKTIKSDPGTVTIDKSEALATAWRFPVDTDNNGKFDSYTLYGIYFRSPNITNGQPSTARNPLEARAKPMDDSAGTGQCAAALGSAASLVGNTGWYKTGAEIKKSFFTYSVTVPINNPPADAKYEKYVGNKGFSAIEYQQDIGRIPLSNNAVVYEDDLQISPGPAFRLNGRVVTNSNLIVSKINDDQPIRLYQVSSKESCYFDEESAKILVGGNVSNGTFTRTTGKDVNVDLFQGLGKDIKADKIDGTNESTGNDANVIAYNSAAYNERINLLVEAQLAKDASTDPSDVKAKVALADASVQPETRRKELEIYFRNRTRRVPFYEVPGTSGTATALGSYTTANVLQGSGDTLRPPDSWIYPTDPTTPGNGAPNAVYTGLTLITDQLQALNPEKQKELRKEDYLGDRIKVGNNLPSLWWFTKILNFAGDDQPQEMTGVAWTDGTTPRGRYTRVRRLDDLGITDRNGFWEDASTKAFNAADQMSGGLRVITGAGVYERKNSFLPPPKYDDPTTATIESGAEYVDPKNTAHKYPMVWPDTMPMSPGGANSQVFNNAAVTPGWTQLPITLPAVTGTTIDPTTPQYAKGDLRMRAAAVYHYTQDAYTGGSDYQTPIACVSSYYDPTNSITARNPSGLGAGTDVSGEVSGTQPTFAQGARSNNGVVYPKPTTTAATLTGATEPSSSTGLFSGDENSSTLIGRLNYQANLKFPNGRFVNEPLRDALIKKAKGQPLTLRDQAAIDSTICSLDILSPTSAPATSNPIPNGAIKEVAFLDGRQIKAASRDNNATPALETFTNDGRNTTDVNINAQEGYRLELEQRQPLEIRATALNIQLLRTNPISGGASQEYLLPNSGIIYASRDDALLDLSDDPARNIDQRKLVSPVDFKLDPTRRPNGIVLFNGSKLWRTETFREVEKGLIFATDLPTYIQGNFNEHTQEEFTEPLNQDTWGNFYTRTADKINKNFACRKNDPRLPECTVGDEWRPATVLADSVTVLSQNFKFGFRMDGDYDLQNNSGDGISITKRLKNGFWNNNFVTSRDFTDTEFSTGTAGAGSSYFNNFVTPIQRRAAVPEYVMEICRKLPVSQCGPNDWVVGYDQDANGILELNELNIKAKDIPLDTIPAGALVSGTTARKAGTLTTATTSAANPTNTTIPAARPNDERFPRRIAFKRTRYNALALSDAPANAPTTKWGSGRATVIPFGINSSGRFAQFPYTNKDLPTIGTELPRLATNSNALWFRTTDNDDGRPFNDRNTNLAEDDNDPLFYTPPAVDGKMILPDTQCFTNSAIVPCQTTYVAGTVNLNLPTTNKVSDYILCMGAAGSGSGNTAGFSKEFQISSISGSACNADVRTAVNNAYGVGGGNGLKQFTANIASTALPTNGQSGANERILSGTINATGSVNVYDFPANRIANGTTIRLSANGQSDPIFVLRGDNLLMGADTCPANTDCGVKIELDGVSPNDVFWVADGMNFGDAGTGRHRLVGNFMGNSAAPQIGDKKVDIEGGRILGYSQFPGFPSTPPESPPFTITAVTADGQPMVWPVLQLQNTTRTLSDDTNKIVKETNWLQKAGSTIVNVVFATGDTPARVDPKATKDSPTEDNGGLQNFVRFLEVWNGVDSRISGSFIQLKRSNFATAPLSPVLNGFEPTQSLFDYTTAYRTDNEGGRVPFYTPPTRKWGFDVALLSQLPDLFSQRFTIPPAGAPNEFFREVGRDDEWVRPLLCAAIGEKTASNTYNYSTSYAVDTVELPNRNPASTDKSCRPLADYNK